ncbi:glycerol uptake operon antiterminator regulatory protein [Sporomusaceae bacterium FL31]|nr:glycerol uptake operon antiterminator regulatory protein [Sporomusaceae bacterium FL31]GCE32436.1 glycerol uptake operon antiterminator regulatory protein [Sporomusaceae bacterium]
MGQGTICNSLFSEGSIVPAARTINDFKSALTSTVAPSVILLFGDIIILPELLAEAKKYNKRVLVHLDLLGGIGKDKAGIKFLARMGVTGAITTKPQLVKYAREEGMIVIQRLFLMDSEALRSGIHLLHSCKPDAVEILPASVPASTIQELFKETGLPILAGGLIYTAEDAQSALQKGIHAVSTSRRDLWK